MIHPTNLAKYINIPLNKKDENADNKRVLFPFFG